MARLVLASRMRCPIDSYTHKCDPLQEHGHASELWNLHSDALSSEDEAGLPQGHGHDSADTQLEREGRWVRFSTGRAVRSQFKARWDKLIVIAALFMLLPLHHHTWSFLLVLSLQRCLKRSFVLLPSQQLPASLSPPICAVSGP